MRPFFSIVMPTRNRAKTLEYAIQTALFQDFDDYEVVVSDNCSVDHTEDVVRGQQDPKVRYLRTPSPLAMSKNWEYGLSQARGTYRLILSDDDGLLRDSLSNLHRSIRETGAKIVRWHRAQYNWPNYSLWGLYENLLIYTKPRSESRFMPSDAIVRNAIRYLDCSDTPGLVNSAIHADVFEELQKRTGMLILSYSPDTCSGITMPCL
ncbi:MAG: glycosyltransferase family 2 protein, partial [Nitrospinota bacterium]|nr:glycosyltransferase family 2 protein [Nitrospinota bacterium]